MGCAGAFVVDVVIRLAVLGSAEVDRWLEVGCDVGTEVVVSPPLQAPTANVSASVVTDILRRISAPLVVPNVPPLSWLSATMHADPGRTDSALRVEMIGGLMGTPTTKEQA